MNQWGGRGRCDFFQPLWDASDIESFAISDNKIVKEMYGKFNSVLHSYEVYEIADIIGVKGKELSVRVLNSLSVSEPLRAKDIVQKAINECRMILVLANHRTRYNDTIIYSYFTKQIIQLLCNGVYCINYNLPDKYYEVLFNLFRIADVKSVQVFQNSLKLVWGTQNIQNFIVEVVSNLSQKSLYSKNAIADTNNLENVVKSFFVFIEPLICQEIVTKTENAMRGR